MADPFSIGRKKVHLCSPSNVVNYSFEWTIENFNFYESSEGKYEYIYSPLIKTENGNYSWKLKLFYNGKGKDSEGFISLFLVNMSQKNDFFTNGTFSILNCSSIEKCSFEMSRSVPDWGYSKFASRETLFKDPVFLSTKCLVVLCEIGVLERGSEQCCEGLTIEKTVTLSGDFSNLLKSKDSSDVILKVGQDEFKVHKLILAARSPVFAAMFTHNFQEEQTNVVKIEDTSATVMEEVIHYIYTDEFPKISELAEDVLPVADKYALLGLKDICAQYLYSQLTVNNAVHLLLVADLYNVPNLKENIMNFIVTNSRSILVTPSWIEMENNKHPLFTEVASAIFAKLRLSPQPSPCVS